MSNSFNPPDGYTGAIQEQTCGQCHSGGDFYEGKTILSGLPSKVLPNTTYTISLTASYTGDIPPQSTGFQLTARDANNDSAGTISNNSSGTKIVNYDNKTYLEHSPSLLFGNNNQINWSFDWTSPPIDQLNETINFYTSTVIANNDITSQGDLVIDKTYTTTVAAATLDYTLVNYDDISCNGENDGYLFLLAKGGLPPYTYEWSDDSDNTIEGKNLSPGTYFITITDATNTELIASFTFSDPPPLALTIDRKVDIDCANETGVIRPKATGGTPAYRYAWNTGLEDILFFDIKEAGEYSLTVTDANGCEASITETIAVDTIIPLINIETPNTLNCSEYTALLSGSGSVIGSNYTYEWSNDKGENIANNLNASTRDEGIYTLTILDESNACTATQSVEVIKDRTIPFADAGPDRTLTCDGREVILDGSNSNSMTGVELDYTWFRSDGLFITKGEFAVVNEVGTYLLLLSNKENACTSNDIVEVRESEEVPIAHAGEDIVLDCAMAIRLDGHSSSVGPFLTYEWTTQNGNIIFGENTVNPAVDQSGLYELVVTNTANGCSSSSSVMVTINPQLSVQIEGSNMLNCIENTIQLQANTPNSSNFNYEWSTSNGNIISDINNQNIQLNSAGLYTVTVTSTANTCTNTASWTVLEDTETPIIAIETPSIFTCVTPFLWLDATASSKGNQFIYAWTTTDGEILEDAETLTPRIGAIGTYQLTITNEANGCSNSETVIVQGDTNVPMISLSQNAVLTCAESTIILDASASSNGVDYTYEWSTLTGNIIEGANTLNPLVDQVGIYTLSIINEISKCTTTSSIEVISDNSVPDIALEQEGILDCKNGMVILTSGNDQNNLSYEWTTTDGHFLNNNNNSTINVAAEGRYELVITNIATGCTASDFIEVSMEDGLPNVIFNETQTITCATQTIPIQALNLTNLEYTFEWTTIDGNILTGENSAVILVDRGGTYQFSITNNTSACSALYDINILENTETPIANAGIDISLTCDMPSVFLDGTASTMADHITYEWSGEHMVSGATTLFPEVDQAGTYTLTVTNNENQCTSQSSTIVYSDIDAPIANAGENKQITCMDSVVILDATASSQGTEFSYVWTSTTATILSGANTLTPTVSQAGIYELNILNNNNACTAMASVEVIQAPELAIELANLHPLTCADSADGAIEIMVQTGTPPYNYNWESGQTTAAIDNLEAGLYTVEVVDANACTETLAISINEVEALVLNMDLTNESMFGASDGAINVEVRGGTSPYTYLWSNDATTATIENLAPDTYWLTVTDANGCTVVDSYAINAVNCSISVEMMQQNVSCNGNNNGQASAMVLNGTGEYTYEWSNGATTATATALAAGTYSLTVTDAINCITISTIVIEEPTPLELQLISKTDITNCATPTAMAIVGGSGGIAPYKHEWSDGFVGVENTTLAAGMYDITTTDANACSTVMTIAIAENIIYPEAILASPPIFTCFTSQINLNAGASTGGDQYEWTTTNGNILEGANTAFPIVGQPGDYCLTFSNADTQCSSMACVKVEQSSNVPIADAGMDQTISCVQETVILGSPNTDEGSQFNYFWIDPNNVIISSEQYVEVSDCGDYRLLVRNNINGCLSEDEVTIVCDTLMPIADAGMPIEMIMDCTTESVEFPIQLDASNSSAGDEYIYEWTSTGGAILSGANTLTPIVNEAGQYQLVVSNINSQCSATDEISVSIVDQTMPPEAIVTQMGSLNCTGEVVWLDATASVGLGSLAFEWWRASDDTMISLGNVLEVSEAGIYRLVVLDMGNNCIAESFIEVLEEKPEISLAFGDIECLEATDSLEITAMVTGMYPPFTYHWANGDSTATTTALLTDTWGLTVTDAIGCTNTLDPAMLAFPMPLTIANINIQHESKDQNDGSIAVLAGGGTAPYTYQWNTGHTSSALMGLPAGSYQVTITDANGCIFESSPIIVDYLLNSVSDVFVTQFELYPNPTAGHIWISKPTNMLEKVTLQVYDYIGRLVYLEQDISFEKDQYLLNLQAQSSGLYFIKIITESGTHATYRVVKE